MPRGIAIHKSHLKFLRQSLFIWWERCCQVSYPLGSQVWYGLKPIIMVLGHFFSSENLKVCVYLRGGGGGGAGVIGGYKL